MIHLQTLHKKSLEEFVSSDDFKKYNFLPITAHRARSHIQNPKATDDQTLLILAFDNEKLAGYLGCFPDTFNIEGETFHYAWLSTLFISNEFRGKRIAQSLLNKAFEEYNGNIALTEFTKEAESLYNKIGVFEYIQPKNGKRYYFRTDFEHIIPSKKPSVKPLKSIFQLGDRIFNTLISIKNSFIKKPDFKFEILESIDSESDSFISGFPANRDTDEINWFIKNPWVLEGEKNDDHYLFSSYSKEFKYFWIKIYAENNSLVTCSLLLLRDGHLKILYLFSNDKLDKFLTFLNYFIVKNKVTFLTNYHIELNQKIALSKDFPKIYEKDFERRYMFHQQLLEHLPKGFDPNFQDGDGDCAMT